MKIAKSEIDELLVLLMGNEYLEYFDPVNKRRDVDINRFFELRNKRKYFFFKEKVDLYLNARLRRVGENISELRKKSASVNGN